jgi:phage FluMu protein Com
MDSGQRRVDGNGAAGVLNAILPGDMTMVRTRCATCGRIELAGAELVYMDAPGLVMRCVHCESVLLTVVHGDGRYWLNLPGVVCLQMGES